MERRRLQQVNITVTMWFHFYYGSVSEKIQNYDKIRQTIPERGWPNLSDCETGIYSFQVFCGGGGWRGKERYLKFS